MFIKDAIQSLLHTSKKVGTELEFKSITISEEDTGEDELTLEDGSKFKGRKLSIKVSIETEDERPKGQDMAQNKETENY